MSDFEIGDVKYKVGRISAMTQFHIVRRLAPVMAALAPAFQTIQEAGAGSADEAGMAEALRSIDIGAFMEPLANAIGSLSDEDSEYVIGACMSVVQRQRVQDTGYAMVWNSSAKMPMFDDMTVVDLLMITANVIMAQLGPFTSGLRSGSKR